MYMAFSKTYLISLVFWKRWSRSNKSLSSNESVGLFSRQVSATKTIPDSEVLSIVVVELGVVDGVVSSAEDDLQW